MPHIVVPPVHFSVEVKFRSSHTTAFKENYSIAKVHSWVLHTLLGFAHRDRLSHDLNQHVAELHQELDHASRTGREDLSSGGQWAVESYRDHDLLSNESLQTAANSTKNDRSACGYDDEDSIDGDTVISSPGESDIDDDDLCDVSPNFIAEAADLSHHHSPLLSFEDILAQEE
ncbi:hypothetical protein DL98DRAFT_599056 [Cadophora sp. DSE1049]|nr:hypothetical protein DL98DRAFT_599056 [Cadophora sp. DSE1049]